MLYFCTLFDSYYLDKGIALYNSLQKVSNNFKLFIFCFDNKSYEILKNINFPSVEVIHHSAFENTSLLEIKKERSKAEYCWTCTPVVIEYVLNHYEVEACTYIDSDLYFYSDPQILFNEIDSAMADVTIVEHRFKNNSYGRKLEDRNGKYCVQFNYFRQNANAKNVLKWWKEKCFEWCYDIPEPDRMGDQKYLNKFSTLFNGVHELKHLGGGVAPWNLEKYQIVHSKGNEIWLREENGEKFILVFYHFQNIRYMPGRKVNIKSQTKNKKLKYSIYIPYLKEIEAIREMLIEEYGLDFNPRKLKRSSNPIIGLLQRYFASYKVRILSDVISIKNLDQYQM